MNKSVKIYDNTRVSQYKQCPRKFFYRHVMHWTRDGFAGPLVFGSAWHAAQEVIWPGMVKGVDKSLLIDMAHDVFVQKWVEEGAPHPSEMDYELEKQLSPRTPGNALEMIAGYIEKRYDSISGGEVELVSSEKPFIVPLDPDDESLFYVGKIDKVVKQAGRYRAIEHKTTAMYAKNGGFRSTYIDSFSPNSQVDGYLYALHMTYPGKVGGVWVDAALVHKSEQAFMYIPVEKRIEQLDLWLWEVRSWIDQIEAHKQHYAEHVTPEDKYMAAFPKNTGSCFDFMQPCAYIDLCKAWPNPAGKPLPPGFKVEEWDPLEHIDASQLPELKDGKVS